MLVIPDKLKVKYPVDARVYWRDESYAYYAGLVHENTDWYFGRICTRPLGLFPCVVNIYDGKMFVVQSYAGIPSLDDAMALIHALYLFGDVT